jgi:hypothetical protein
MVKRSATRPAQTAISSVLSTSEVEKIATAKKTYISMEFVARNYNAYSVIRLDDKAPYYAVQQSLEMLREGDTGGSPPSPPPPPHPTSCIPSLL